MTGIDIPDISEEMGIDDAADGVGGVNKGLGNTKNRLSNSGKQ